MLEWVLLALKLAGVIGAFVGLSDKPAGRPRRRRWAFAFLAMAIGAEFTDSLLKRQDSREQAARFERLAHPMGTVHVTAAYSISLYGDALDEYRGRLERGGSGWLPDPLSERIATDLFSASVNVWVALYRDATPTSAPPEGEPDLSFEVEVDGILEKTPAAVTDPVVRLGRIAQERNYNYSNGVINAQVGSLANVPDDRYSNGRIVSTVDLLGAELVIRLCAAVYDHSLSDAERDALAKKVKLDSIYIEFPGRQEFKITPDSGSARTAGPMSDCSYLLYKFPKKESDFKKALLP